MINNPMFSQSYTIDLPTVRMLSDMQLATGKTRSQLVREAIASYYPAVMAEDKDTNHE